MPKHSTPSTSAIAPKTISMRVALSVIALALLCVGHVQAQGTLAPVAQQVFLDNSGNPINGGKVCTYAAGTTTPQPTYYNQDLDVSHQNSNPVILNAAGRPTTGGIYFSATSYKIVLLTAGTDNTCSTGTTIYTQDQVSAVPATAVALDVTNQIAGVTLNAGAAVYLSNGSGSLTAGRWYLADSTNAYSSSTASLVGIVPTTIASGASGTVRIGGRITGLSALTAGTDYYVSTGGALVATPATNTRFVGRADTTTSLILPASNSNQDTSTYAKPSFNQPGGCGGRLTATSGTPITTGDVTAATSIYFTPFSFNGTPGTCGVYDGSSLWTTLSFTEITISLSMCAMSKPYDVFVYNNSGALAAETLVWTSTTARATALAKQDGVYVKSGATTRRYVGTFYCDASGGQTDDSFALRYIWNYYNRVPRAMRVLESADSWNYTTATIRQANNSAANQLDFVIGVAEVPVSAQVAAIASNTNSAVTLGVTIGLDSTSAAATGAITNVFSSSATANEFVAPSAHLDTFPAVGRHTVTWLEYSEATGTTTWYGDNGGAFSIIQAGISGVLGGG